MSSRLSLTTRSAGDNLERLFLSFQGIDDEIEHGPTPGGHRPSIYVACCATKSQACGRCLEFSRSEACRIGLLAYSEDSVWRNRNEFITGREAICRFLAGKWNRELEHRLVKSLWACTEDRIAVRFQYKWHDTTGQWFRSYGNELWEFDTRGLMRRREASINDLAIAEHDRRFFWPAPGARPENHVGIPDVF